MVRGSKTHYAKNKPGKTTFIKSGCQSLGDPENKNRMKRYASLAKFEGR